MKIKQPGALLRLLVHPGECSARVIKPSRGRVISKIKIKWLTAAWPVRRTTPFSISA
ncbi:MAG: hypothetical protein JWN07_2134 [Hyphomicrobiales bacterium]|nr:hypothetical protein [Hyphomicrobiales bacterium]